MQNRLCNVTTVITTMVIRFARLKNRHRFKGEIMTLEEFLLFLSEPNQAEGV